MTVNTLTLYMPGSSVGIQVYEGSQLHLILVSQGANSIPSAPGQTVRKDPFPQYVDDDELAAALAGVGGGGAVASVNGQTGAVVLDADDIGAVADDDPRLSDARTPTTHTHGVTDLTATGTKSATTFLRGDNAWAVPPGTGDTAAPEPTGNDRAALQSLIDALPAGGGVVRLRGGTYTLSGSPLVLPSKVTLAGAGRGSTIIKQTTAGVPVIVSRNWLSATGAGPGGNTHIRDLTVYGATGTGAHGIVLRDFYSSIIEVSVYDCGGHGILVSSADDAGTHIAGTLVENRYDRIDIHNSAGWGFYNNSNAGILTDSMLGHINVAGGAVGAPGTGGVRIESAAGWQIGHIHAYGYFSGSAVHIQGAWNTWLNSAQIEPGWTGTALYCNQIQRALHLGRISVTCNDRAAETAVGLWKSSALNPVDGSTIDALTVVQDYNRATTALTWDNTSAPLWLGELNLCGDFLSQLTPTAGSGASAIRTRVRNGGGVAVARVMTQAAYTALATKDATTLYVIVG